MNLRQIFILNFICSVSSFHIFDYLFGEKCTYDNEKYTIGDTWYSSDKCILYKCDEDDNGDEVTSSYTKNCPDPPDCNPGHIYVENCCQYCPAGEEIVVTRTELDTSLSDYTSHPCKRPCNADEPPMNCEYNFILAEYETMSLACYNCPFNLDDCDRWQCVATDGIGRKIVAVNRQIPGPAIEVCVNDLIIVHIQNDMLAESTTVHWHGLSQMKTPYMDGVPMVTQCPILPYTTFRYTFEADHPGTYFYHSHIGVQRSDGFTGSLIIRQPDDPQGHLYDIDSSEYTALVMDWVHEPTGSLYMKRMQSGIDDISHTFLVNGKGRYLGPLQAIYEESSLHNITIEQLNATLSRIPFEEYHVEQGLRYRFRVIQGGFLACPVAISVDNHTLLVISSDGYDIEPIEVQSLVTNAGERYDFVINANQSIDNYWIRFKGLCVGEVQQFAILRYSGTESGEPAAPIDYFYPPLVGLELNTPKVGPGEIPNTITVSELQSLTEDENDLSQDEPDERFIISFGFYEGEPGADTYFPPGFTINNDDTKFLIQSVQLNFISFSLPPMPLLSQPFGPNDSYVCNDTSLIEQGVDCKNHYCLCTQTRNAPKDSLVEVILVDYATKDGLSHPMHLHGYSFSVFGMGSIENISYEKIVQMANNNELRQNYNNRPPIKDTVTVPTQGYTVYRFRANNPGYWLMHCHLEFHLQRGMAIVFKVGNQEEFVPVPEDFPTCGDFEPELLVEN